MELRRFARGFVHPLKGGMFVANAGDVKPVPAQLVPQLKLDGYFDEKWDEATEQFDAGELRIIKGRSSGRLLITGPDFGAAETFRSEAEVRARLHELKAVTTAAKGKAA